MDCDRSGVFRAQITHVGIVAADSGAIGISLLRPA